jgi:hypothetical protein
VFMVKNAALGRRIAGLTGGYSPAGELLGVPPRPASVVPWPGPDPGTHAALADALARKTP